MSKYALLNDINSIEFHDSNLEDVHWTEDTLTFLFSSVIIVGHSCPGLSNHPPCSLNTGEDRYAMPCLTLTLRDYQIHSILRGVCWSQDAEGNSIEKYPPRLLKPTEYADLLNLIHNSHQRLNHVYGIHFEEEKQCYNLAFFLNQDVNYYEIDFSARQICAQWEEYGDIAWYVKNYRRHKKAQNSCKDVPVFGVIENQAHRFYTYLSNIFPAIQNAQLDYNWLITDVEGNYTNQIEDTCNKQGYCWLTGDELTELVKAQDFQWIWGILSGIPKEYTLEDVLKHQPLPISDGYSGFWHNPISLQHPLAEVEIVPWDSSYTLLISKNEKIISDFRTAYPQSQDLTEYNNR